MKTITAIVLVFAFAALAGDAPSPTMTTSGRYQLVAAPVDVALMQGDKGTAVHLNVIIRLDTSTGQAWTLRMVSRGDKFSSDWFPVSEPTASK